MAYYFLARCKEYRKQDYHRSLNDYLIIVNDFSQSSLVFRALERIGDIKSKLGDYIGAIESYNKGIDANPIWSNMYYRRGLVRNILKDYTLAIEDFDRAISLFPSFEYYRVRSIAKIAIGDMEGAFLDDKIYKDWWKK